VRNVLLDDVFCLRFLYTLSGLLND